jgi:hypothetical protein
VAPDLAVTNYHVVEDGVLLRVEVAGEVHEGTVLAADTPEIGEPAVALGFPRPGCWGELGRANGPGFRSDRRGSGDLLAEGTTDGGRSVRVVVLHDQDRRLLRPIAAWEREEGPNGMTEAERARRTGDPILARQRSARPRALDLHGRPRALGTQELGDPRIGVDLCRRSPAFDEVCERLEGVDLDARRSRGSAAGRPRAPFYRGT